MPPSAVEEQLLDAFKMLGWRVAHFRPLLTKKGWRTPVSGDGKGFPDFVAVRGDRLLFVEAKGETNDLEPEQAKWRDALFGADAEYHLVRPSNIDNFVRTVLAAR